MQQTLTGHIEELRRRVLFCVFAIGAASFAAYYYGDALLALVMAPLKSRFGQAYFFSPADAFVIRVKLALLAGFIGMSPVWISQTWFFVSPGLHRHEKKALLPIILVTSGLFMFGAFFSFRFVLPAALQFFAGQSSEWMKPMISAQEYIGFLSGMMLAFGVAFNSPVFILGLVFVGMLSSRQLIYMQKQAIVLIFIAAAVLTPGPDIASQLLLAAPLLALYELSIVGAKVIELSRRRK